MVVLGGSPTGKTDLKKSKVCSEAWRKLEEEGTVESKSTTSGCVPTVNHFTASVTVTLCTRLLSENTYTLFSRSNWAAVFVFVLFYFFLFLFLFL